MEVKSVELPDGRKIFPVLAYFPGDERPFAVRLYAKGELDVYRKPQEMVQILGGIPYELIESKRLPPGDYKAEEIILKLLGWRTADTDKTKEIILKLLESSDQKNS